MRFAKSLPTSAVYDALQDAQPVSDITTYSGTDNQRRLFETAPPPSGLCVIGDASCYFNPVNVSPPTLIGHSLADEDCLHVICLNLSLHGKAVTVLAGVPCAERAVLSCPGRCSVALTNTGGI